MAVVSYDDGSDSYRVRSVNLESGSASDTYSPEDRGDLAAERLLRSRYPLLCQRFLDGYTVEQCARAERVSVAEAGIRIARELRRAERDPLTQAGLGRALITMSSGKDRGRSRENRLSHMIYGGTRYASFDDLGEVAHDTTALLRPDRDKFDCIVTSGLSGVSVGSVISLRLFRPLVVVRKESDQNGHHSGGEIIGRHHLYNANYLILDDFMSSGHTVDYIRQKVLEETADAHYVAMCQYSQQTVDWVQ